MNKQRYFKVPQGIYRKARIQGVEKPLMFWYRCKTVNTEGRLVKGTIVTQLRSITRYSNSSIRRYISKLVQLGWLIDHGSYYQLCSYDKLFACFFYDLKWNSLSKRKGSFLIFKIHFAYINHLEARIAFCELRRNLSSQRKSLKHQYRRKKLQKRIGIQASSIQGSKNQNAKIAEKYNSDNRPKLSCLMLAELLGYDHASKGHELQQTLCELKWITKSNVKDFVPQFLHHKGRLPYSVFRDRNGLTWKQLCNEINIVN